MHDQFSNAGPLAGIERAFDAAASPLVLVLAVDWAAMSTELLRRLAAASVTNVGVVPRFNRELEPLAAFYPKGTQALVGAQLERGNFAVKEFAERCVRVAIAALSNWRRAMRTTSLIGIRSPM